MSFHVILPYLIINLIGCLLLQKYYGCGPLYVFKPHIFVTQLLVASMLFCVPLLVSGDLMFALFTSWGFVLLIESASRIKSAVLDEPLTFSDFAILRNFVHTPGFYLFCIPVMTRVILLGCAFFLCLVFIVHFQTNILCHLYGGLMLLAGLGAGRLYGLQRLTPAPSLRADIERFGLLPTLYLYWRAARRQRPMPPPPPTPRTPPRAAQVLVIQCESFADSATLGLPEALVLAHEGLKTARRHASLHGRLLLNHFGAYTMRTEYGVLFGQSEEELGFYAFDPFLVAKEQAAHCLAHKLKEAGFSTVFAHPHDLRFYQRGRIMPHIGFERVLGQELCPHTPTAQMPHLPDRELGRACLEQLKNSPEPAFLYAVTMENHGPWPHNEQGRPVEHYLRHLAHSDALLKELIETLHDAGTPTLLVFFGDHRPALPETGPEHGRHTPFFVIPFHMGTAHPPQEAALTPAQLHHHIMAALFSHEAGGR